ncbi:hypothetical protein [Paraburkholderia sp. EG304]|uniref:hypothetical protein n=1 Tax=Paraburkholderia sp. EG304 TaxID=3237015 RepID=UPI0039783BA5
MTAQHLNRYGIAMRLHLQHENERLREALRLIADMSEHSTSALVLGDIARIARVALVTAHVPPNPTIAPREQPASEPSPNEKETSE